MTRARLLDAAIALFSDRPYEDVAVADIARRADAAHGLLFHHYGSKRGVYLAALEELVGRQKERRQADFDETQGGGLRAALEAHFGSVAATPEPFLRAMTIGVGGDPEAHAIFESDRWDAIEALARHLGLTSKSHAVQVALRGAVGGIDHAALTWLGMERPFPFEALVDMLVEIIGGGINAVVATEPGVDIAQALTVVDAARRR